MRGLVYGLAVVSFCENPVAKSTAKKLVGAPYSGVSDQYHFPGIEKLGLGSAGLQIVGSISVVSSRNDGSLQSVKVPVVRVSQ